MEKVSMFEIHLVCMFKEAREKCENDHYKSDIKYYKGSLIKIDNSEVTKVITIQGIYS